MSERFYRNRLRAYGLAVGIGLLAWAAYDASLGQEAGEAALRAMLSLGALALLAPRAGPRATAAHAGALLGLAALGTFSPTLFGYGRPFDVRFDLMENLAHAALGAWGAYVAAHMEEKRL